MISPLLSAVCASTGRRFLAYPPGSFPASEPARRLSRPSCRGAFLPSSMLCVFPRRRVDPEALTERPAQILSSDELPGLQFSKKGKRISLREGDSAKVRTKRSGSVRSYVPDRAASQQKKHKSEKKH